MSYSIYILYQSRLIGDCLYSMITNCNGYSVKGIYALSHMDVGLFSFPSIVVLETGYLDVNILSIIKDLKKRNHLVILVGHLINNELVEQVIKEGLDGFVLKGCSKRNFLEAIIQVGDGSKYFCSKVTELLSSRLSRPAKKLTDRELQVLLQLVSLKNTKEISSVLNISEATVRTHRKNIMSKLGSKNYMGLLRYACREGFLDSCGPEICKGCSRFKHLSTHLR